MEIMFMQNFGGANKEYYGIIESGLLSPVKMTYFCLKSNVKFNLILHGFFILFSNSKTSAIR